MANVEEEEEEDEEEYEEKGATHTTCSRGVSTEEGAEEEEEEIKHKQSQKSGVSPRTELNLDTNSLSSPPSTTSSTPSDNPAPSEADPIGSEPMLSRNSMLLSLIACGGTGSFRRAVLPASVKEAVPGRKSCSGGSSLHKGVVCKAAKMATEEERVMISYMSENPRFGNSQAEEKEYFSGSIVESMTNDCANEPVLKKSSSYNQER
ncbi:hypothetical protein SASPL_153721 [Salvia splendens]|uniref:Uncharacterized protein n=2 Tax=Salvia splendens TaxID=180675 RepID=A0A8X8YYK6_SALSN|nr:hypothetical protein SASPL_153721 [Salvia splendens]